MARSLSPAGISLLILAASCLVNTQVSARQIETTPVRGVVTALETHEPLAGAFVEIANLDLRTRTDAHGRYVFAQVPFGRHALVVRILGRAPQRRWIEPRAGNALFVDIALKADPLLLPAIEVLRERTELAYGLDDIPGSVHVIAANGRGNAYHDVHQVLRQVPGVNVRDEDGFGLRPNIGIRGTGSERSAKITLMEDGVLIAPAPYAAPAAYYFPVLGMMQAIEVRKGSSQIKYGPRTTGGAVNLVSASIPEELDFTADVAGGQNATGRVQVRMGDSYDNVGWLAEAYGIRSDGFKELVEGETGFDVQNYSVKLRLNNDRASTTYQELQLKLGHYIEESDETYLGLTDPDFRLTPNRRYPGSQIDVMNAEHNQINVRHFVRPGGRFDLTTTVYRTELRRNWFKLQSVDGRAISEVLDRAEDFPNELAILGGGNSAPDALRVRANNRSYYAHGVQTVVGVQIGEAIHHAFELGGRFHQDQEDRFQHEDRFQMSAGRMSLTTAGIPGSQSNRIGSASALALFLQDEITVGKWGVTPGLRYEHIKFTRVDYAADDPSRSSPIGERNNSVSVLIPGAGVSYAVRRDMRVFAGVHRGFGPPGPGADRDTKAETSVNYELGARYRANGIGVQVVGYLSDYGNMLGTATLAAGGDGSGDPVNGGAVAVRGLEVSGEYDPIASPGTVLTFPARLAFTYTHAEFRSTFESDFEPWGSVQVGEDLPYLPRAQFDASIGARHWRWSANLSASYSGSMRNVAGDGSVPERERIAAFLVLNALADYRWTPGTSFYLSVQNIANASYIVSRRPAGARPGLPRTVLGGVKINR